MTLSINAKASPTSEELEHVIEALFDVCDSLKGAANLEQYEVIDWSDVSPSSTSTDYTVKSNDMSLEKKLILPLRPGQHESSTENKILNLRRNTEQSQTTVESTSVSRRHLSSGVASIEIRISSDVDIRSSFDTCDAWIDQVSSELSYSQSSGSLDQALEKECGCELTVGIYTILFLSLSLSFSLPLSLSI